MSITYDEILNSMKTAFFNEKGEAVHELSDLELRFKAVASEIYSVASYGDYVLKQSFPQTATGEFLDRHAALRRITRKTASFSSGVITVSRTENSLGTAMNIPKGTVFSVSEKPFIQFSTDEAANIAADESSVDISVTALKAGDEHNISAGIALEAVNPPAHLQSAVSKTDFSGGWDSESDEALRERILGSYKCRKNAVSASAVRETLLTLEEVTDAYVCAAENYTMCVCLKTKSGKISEELRAEAENMLGFALLCGVAIEFTAAEKQPFAVTAEAKVLSGYDTNEIKSRIKAKITEFCSDEKIGKNYSESAIAAYCGDIDGVEYINVFIGSDSVAAAACASTGYLKLEKVEVYTHEQ